MRVGQPQLCGSSREWAQFVLHLSLGFLPVAYEQLVRRWPRTECADFFHEAQISEPKFCTSGLVSKEAQAFNETTVKTCFKESLKRCTLQSGI